MMRAVALAALTLLIGLLAVQAVATPQKIYGLNYNPRRVVGACPTLDQVREDLAILKAYTSTLRIYSLTDCSQGTLVLQAAKETGMKVHLGMWITNDTALFPAEFAALKGILSSSPSLLTNVESVIVGSEAIYRKELTVEEVSKYMSEVRTTLRGAGLKTPVTFADVFRTFLENPALVNAVDIGMVNQFPFWEGKPIETAVDYLFETMTKVKTAFGSKRFIISETGWPDGGKPFGDSIPSPENQKMFFDQFICRANAEKWEYLYFAAFDDEWKPQWERSEIEVEIHWGIFEADRTLKKTHNSKMEIDCSAAPTSGSPTSTGGTTGSGTTNNGGTSSGGSSTSSGKGGKTGTSPSSGSTTSSTGGKPSSGSTSSDTSNDSGSSSAADDSTSGGSGSANTKNKAGESGAASLAVGVISLASLALSVLLA